MFTREKPSERYRLLISMYQQMHADGIPRASSQPDGIYAGRSLLPHLQTIRALVRATGAKSILDYGSGKGAQYRERNITFKDGSAVASVQEYLGVERIACFDPAVPEYAKFSAEQFDGVISTDVLEHIPEEDLPWVVEEMFASARKFVFANVASYPALKTMPNGENAHCTQRPAAWWDALLAGVSARHPGVKFHFEIKELNSSIPVFLAKVLGRRFRFTTLAN